jgi:hypothetical protein
VSQDTPKLHGWITPEDAMYMVKELLDYLTKVDDGLTFFNKLDDFIEVGRFMKWKRGLKPENANL